MGGIPYAEQFAREMQASFDREIRTFKDIELQKERLFAINHGAKLVLIALLDAGALDPAVAEAVQEWKESDGVAVLDIYGQRIIPPEYVDR